MGKIGRRIVKAYYKSRTIVINIIAALPAIALAVMPFLGLPEVAALVPAEYVAIYTLVLALGNLYLRKITTGPVGAKDEFEE